jgi:hypothetical protein
MGLTIDTAKPAEDSKEEGSAVIERFGTLRGVQEAQEDFVGIILLKTKSGNFREYYTRITGQEIYFYKAKDVEPHEFMHSLKGTFVEEKGFRDTKTEEGSKWTIKIKVSAQKARILYFQEESEYKRWVDQLKRASGYSNLMEFYDMVKDVGKGQFGVVKLATHKKTGQKVAIKTIKKKDMKASALEL